MERNKIFQGDSLSVLKSWEDSVVDCVVTSPPYWALRDYGIDGQLGLETTFDEYISKLCDIFDETKRVLKPSGSVWVNIGDTYASSGKIEDAFKYQSQSQGFSDGTLKSQGRGRTDKIQSKSLIGIPFRFALEMMNRGWILRNTLIWHKPNCMPSSARDRFTVDFEYLFFFVKSKKYYFEQQRESWGKDKRIVGIERARKYGYKGKGSYQEWYDKQRKKKSWHDHTNDSVEGFGQQKRGNKVPNLLHPLGKNKRCVWKITTKGHPFAHFAVFPEELVEIPIKAGCPEFVCKKCGKPREKEYKHELINTVGNSKKDGAIQRSQSMIRDGKGRAGDPIKTFLGYSDCGCNAGWDKGVVLDPFFGSGTVGAVAKRLKRDWVGIELSPEYAKIAERRLAGVQNWGIVKDIDEGLQETLC